MGVAWNQTESCFAHDVISNQDLGSEACKFVSQLHASSMKSCVFSLILLFLLCQWFVLCEVADRCTLKAINTYISIDFQKMQNLEKSG